MGDPEAQPAELLAQALLAEHAGRAVGAAGRPLDHGVQVDRRACGNRAGRGDEAGLDLAGAPALADDQVAQHARSAARAVVGGDRLGARPLADLVAGRVVGLGGEQAVVDVDDLGPAAAAWKPSTSSPSPRAERVLELVAVAPLLDRRHDRLELEALEAADPAQRLVDLLRLLGELALVGQPLPGGAGAGLAVVDAAVGDPVGARARAARPSRASA